MDLRQALKANRLFAKFGDNGLAILATAAQAKPALSGKVIFDAESPGSSLFIVASGEVILQVGNGPNAREVARLGAGEHFGQMALLNPGPRRVTALAANHVMLVEIAREPFLQLYAKKPQACLKLLLAICEDFGVTATEAAPTLLKLLGANG